MVSINHFRDRIHEIELSIDKPEPSRLQPQLELRDFQLDSARDLFHFSSELKIDCETSWNFNSQLKTYFLLLFIIKLTKLCINVSNHSPNQNFPPFSVNNLFKFSTQGSDLEPFVGNGTEVKIPSEIKPPLTDMKIGLLMCFLISGLRNQG